MLPVHHNCRSAFVRGPMKGQVWRDGVPIGDVVEVTATVEIVDPVEMPDLSAQDIREVRSGTLRVTDAGGDWLESILPAFTPKRRKNMPKNPYDRRGAGDYARGGRIRSPHADELVNVGEYRPPADPAKQRLEMADEVDTPRLTLRDLEELVASKVRRARRDGDDAAYIRGQEEKRLACAEAWDAGRMVGTEAARSTLLEAIDNRVGAAVRAKVERLQGILEAAEAPTTKVAREATSKDALLTELADTRRLLAELVEAHHDGFEERPF